MKRRGPWRQVPRQIAARYLADARDCRLLAERTEASARVCASRLDCADGLVEAALLWRMSAWLEAGARRAMSEADGKRKESR